MASGPASERALRKSIADGLLYTHLRLSENTHQNLEVASFLYSLIELLSEKQILSIDELDARKHEVQERLVRKNTDRGVGVLLQEGPEQDKYSFASEARIDCENRIEYCRAACCRLPFALSKQDIHEGVIRWDLGQPYVIEQGEDGYCSHLERGSCHCTVRDARPIPCRAFDCSTNRNIWLDFDNKIINPDIRRPDWPRNVPAAQAAEPA
jgi:hypothetical protein